MEMKDPLHPGEVVANSLEELGMSVSAAARGLGTTRQQLHNLIAGRSAVSPEMAVRLELALGSTADNWLRMQAIYDLAKVRKRSSEFNIRRFDSEAA
jgi:addiction module HigA family antidote